MNKLLLLDDEPNILNALKRQLHGSGHEGAQLAQHCDSFTSAHAALQAARHTAYDLAIVDFKMPEMNGALFLQELHKIQPNVPCILLSGQVDREGLIDAINAGHIFRFLSKPWPEHELQEAIHQGLSYSQAAREHQRLVEQLRSEHGEIPSYFRPDQHYQVLLVDDEENVLRSLERDLSDRAGSNHLFAALRHRQRSTLDAPLDAHGYRYIVDSHSSPAEALQRAEQIRYDLAIVDYRLPQMNGVDFLASFQARQPDAARVLLSGVADLDILRDALSRGGITAFIAKPWEKTSLRNTLAQALAQRNLLLDNRLLADLLKRKTIEARTSI